MLDYEARKYFKKLSKYGALPEVEKTVILSRN
jgi:hypothetical protein